MIGLVPGGAVYFANNYKKARDDEAVRHRYAAELQEQLLDEQGTQLNKYYRSWRIEWSELKLGNLIGVGAFGEVSSAAWAGNTGHFLSNARCPKRVGFTDAGAICSVAVDTVAVKMMRGHDLSTLMDTRSAAFQDEADTLMALRSTPAYPRLAYVHGGANGAASLHSFCFAVGVAGEAFSSMKYYQTVTPHSCPVDAIIPGNTASPPGYETWQTSERGLLLWSWKHLRWIAFPCHGAHAPRHSPRALVGSCQRRLRRRTPLQSRSAS